MTLKPLLKAATAFVGCEAAAVGAAMTDGSLSWPEVIAGTGVALVTAFATWRVPYAPSS